jgi:hypothetical protein
MSPVSYHALHEADTVCDEKQDADTLNHEGKKNQSENMKKKKERKKKSEKVTVFEHLWRGQKDR